MYGGLVVSNNAVSTDIAAIHVIAGSSGDSRITFGDNAQYGAGAVAYDHATDRLRFGAGGFNGLVTLYGSNGFFAVGSGTPLTRLHVFEPGDVATFDRLGSDGVIVRLAQGGVTEGTISVSGVTVSYNAFTGSHYGWTEEKLERGELVSLTGINRYSHDKSEAEIIYGIKKSAVPNDPACLGSYLELQNPGQSYSSDNPHLVMAVGNGEMWVADNGKNIKPGDYLISSSTPGHAMKDDESKYLIGHVVARAAEAVDWSNVTETANGSKHKKISVLFGNFVRSSATILYQTVEEQQRQIEDLSGRMMKLEAGMPRSQVEN
ncbi:MAG: hypothetical protein L0Y74_00905 [candidate division Zixibacteria bacterium]|nr:hypothetical protein [candidate division Zixibacteria bacterium]